MHTPILLPDGRLFKWNYSGFGSGYQQTQIMDTFSNAIMIATCLSALGVDIENDQFWILIQGDDSIVKFIERMYQLYGDNFLHMMEAAAKHYFNAKLNAKKSKISDSPSGHTVLGYMNLYGVPFRTDEDLLAHLVFPERTPQTYQKLMASAIGLAYASCGCSQRFYDLCVYIVKKLADKGFSPNPRDLTWMVKIAALPEGVDLKRMVDRGIPPFMELQITNYQEHFRLDSEKMRVWPTKPTEASRFYFLLV